MSLGSFTYPKGMHAIDPGLCTVKYASFDAAVATIAKLGKGTLMAKYGIKSAFTLLPVNADGFDFLGFTFVGAFYYDKALHIMCFISHAAFEHIFGMVLVCQVRRQFYIC